MCAVLFLELLFKFFDCVFVCSVYFLEDLAKELFVNREFCYACVFLEKLGLFFQGFLFLAGAFESLEVMKIAQISSP